MNMTHSIGAVPTAPVIPGRGALPTPSSEPGVRVFPSTSVQPQTTATEKPQTEQALARAVQEQKREEEVDPEQLQEDLTKVDSSSNTGLRFRVEQKSGKVVVEVVDSQTGDVVRQIPSEEALRIAQNLADGCCSGLVDDRV